MAEIVFVLGAGASKHAGAPLCADFLEKSRELLDSRLLNQEEKDDFNLVFKARQALMAHTAYSRLDVDNIESLFGAFEMAALFERLGTMEAEEAKRLPSAIRTLIARTVELTFTFRIEQGSVGRIVTLPGSRGLVPTDHLPRMRAPKAYAHFADLVQELSKSRPTRVAIISFNYDLGVDFSLMDAEIPFDYGFSDNEMSVGLYKLHGSLNWGRCAKCQNIQVLGLRDYLKSGHIKIGDYVKLSESPVDFSRGLPSLHHCGNVCLSPEPVIVPPTWNKGKYHSELCKVWRKAAAVLRTAQRIYVCGYSYPVTDEFFRYLYALGSIGNDWLRRFVVFNPEASKPNSEIQSRFRGLLGPMLEGRFECLGNKFEEAVAVMKSELVGKGNQAPISVI